MASPESQKHAQTYWDHGFVSAIPVVSPEEAVDHRGHLESAEHQMGHALHYHSKVHTLLKSPLELATHPALVDVVEAILGPDVMLYNVTYIIKEPKTVKFVSWHQDLTYWGFDGTEQASAWLALSPATAESGCMQMIPGSHRQGLREQITSDDPDNVLLNHRRLRTSGRKMPCFALWPLAKPQFIMAGRFTPPIPIPVRTGGLDLTSSTSPQR